MIHDNTLQTHLTMLHLVHNSYRYIDLIELNVSDQYKAHSFHDLRYSYYDVRASH